MAENPAGGDEEGNEPSPPKLPLKERFVWLWHPHFWLTALVIVVVIWLLMKLAN